MKAGDRPGCFLFFAFVPFCGWYLSFSSFWAPQRLGCIYAVCPHISSALQDTGRHWWMEERRGIHLEISCRTTAEREKGLHGVAALGVERDGCTDPYLQGSTRWPCWSGILGEWAEVKMMWWTAKTVFLLSSQFITPASVISQPRILTLITAQSYHIAIVYFSASCAGLCPFQDTSLSP